ncbi:hypothetical protein C0J52_16343 [Blattella germanica]|nr:hypothetical protein C0J52_16343 [Blattella germanica]
MDRHVVNIVTTIIIKGKCEHRIALNIRDVNQMYHVTIVLGMYFMNLIPVSTNQNKMYLFERRCSLSDINAEEHESGITVSITSCNTELCNTGNGLLDLNGDQ